MKYQISLSEFVRDSQEILDSVNHDDAEVVIVRNGVPLAVIVPTRYFPEVVDEVMVEKRRAE